MQSSTLQITYRPIESLIPYARNSRTHSDAQVAQIAASIKEFGWTNPVLIDGEGGIIAGHGRVMAGRKLGIKEAPCIVLDNLTEAQRRAYVIADNKLALNAGWDIELLKVELGDLNGLDFDLSLTGFDPGELANLLAEKTEGLTDEDAVPEAPARAVTVLGDVWVMGKHRLMCGDSTSIDDIELATSGKQIDLICSDPPYGISVVKGAHVGGAKPFGKGRVHGPAKNAIIAPGTYEPIIGDDTTKTAIEHYHAMIAINAKTIVLWGGNYFADALPPSRCWLVWDKENTGTFADAELAWTNADKVVKLIRHQWSGLIKASERGEKRVHPTQKPVALAEWVIDTMAPQAETILDGFLGSGWTLIAAERKSISCIGLELSPAYVDVAIKRWQDFTGKKATLESTGRTFEEMASERYSPAKDGEGSYLDAIEAKRIALEATK